jgi:hypothetical protein
MISMTQKNHPLFLHPEVAWPLPLGILLVTTGLQVLVPSSLMFLLMVSSVIMSKSD